MAECRCGVCEHCLPPKMTQELRAAPPSYSVYELRDGNLLVVRTAHARAVPNIRTPNGQGVRERAAELRKLADYLERIADEGGL